jgi:hypothetical protein
MMRYDWGFNGKRYDPKHLEPVGAGERVHLHLHLVNTTTMWHPGPLTRSHVRWR